MRPDPPFDVLFDAAPDAMFLVDDEGRIRLANDRTSDVFGYAPAELEGSPVERLVPEDRRDGHAALRDAYFEDPTRRPMGADIDLAGQRKDGSTFPIDVGLSPVTVDDDRYVIATVRDVSDRRNLRRKYRTLLETMPDAVVVADVAEGEIIEVNDRATELLGRDRTDLIGSAHTSLHPGGQETRYRELFERAIEADHAVVSTFPDGDDVLVETDSGATVPVEINAQVTRLDGQPVVVGVFRDVSRRRAYERDLEQQLDRVEVLTRILSHDLRGPLNVADGYLEEARDGVESPALEEVGAAHDRMAAILDDVTTMLQDAGDPDVEPVRLSAVATECWDSVTGDRGTLRVVDDAVFEADPRQIKHVLENLFRNSVEHGSTGRRPETDDSVEHGSTGSRPGADDSVEHGGDDVTVRVGVLPIEEGFFVEDDGPGIPADRRDDVLEPGYSTDPDGTGLGLVIVREVATAHGWTVSVTEGLDGGARFEFGGVTVLDVGAT